MTFCKKSLLLKQSLLAEVTFVIIVLVTSSFSIPEGL